MSASLHYRLRCLDSGELYEDSDRGFLLQSSTARRPALLRAEYTEQSFGVDADAPGLFRYRSWLPVRRVLSGAGGAVAFRAEALGAHLGLGELVAIFSGWWPERGAALETCSFKELEALAALARVPPGEKRSLVVSSAGNTGRSFLQIASLHNMNVTVVVPQACLSALWTSVPRGPLTRLVALAGEVDYLDAIQLGEVIAGLDGFYSEGGARNVARRDGMGTSLLAAAELLGRTPQHYVQAVGSGTGAIAAWEMSLRLRQAGRGEGTCRMHLVQNLPFTPMTDAWNAGSRELPRLAEETLRRQIADLHSPVLSNRKPPYGLVGGVYDSLQDTGGFMYAVSRAEAREAGELFERLEGCDLDPAAEVALAGLIQALEGKRIPGGESVALNLTGGGQRRLSRDRRILPAEPDVVFTRAEANAADAARKLASG